MAIKTATTSNRSAMEAAGTRSERLGCGSGGGLADPVVDSGVLMLAGDRCMHEDQVGSDPPQNQKESSTIMIANRINTCEFF